MTVLLKTPTILLFLFTLLTGSPAWADTSSQNHSGENRHWYHPSTTITGSWSVTIQFPTGNSVVMYSFHQDGTITESDNPGFDPGFGGDALSPALGQWEKTGRHKGIAKYQKLAFNQQGQLTTIYTGNVKVQAKRNGTLKGTLSIEARLPGGQDATVFSGLPFTATRIAP